MRSPFSGRERSANSPRERAYDRLSRSRPCGRPAAWSRLRLRGAPWRPGGPRSSRLPTSRPCSARINSASTTRRRQPAPSDVDGYWNAFRILVAMGTQLPFGLAPQSCLAFGGKHVAGPDSPAESPIFPSTKQAKTASKESVLARVLTRLSVPAERRSSQSAGRTSVKVVVREGMNLAEQGVALVALKESES